MSASVIVFPGSNCDRDAAWAAELVTGTPATMVWHRETQLPKTDLVILPGGFAYGDYLRSGAVAARSPIVPDIIRAAEAGIPILGICNGFQLLTEIGLLPGALMRNLGLTFVCRTEPLEIVNAGSRFTSHYPDDRSGTYRPKPWG